MVRDNSCDGPSARLRAGEVYCLQERQVKPIVPKTSPRSERLGNGEVRARAGKYRSRDNPCAAPSAWAKQADFTAGRRCGSKRSSRERRGSDSAGTVASPPWWAINQPRGQLATLDSDNALLG